MKSPQLNENPVHLITQDVKYRTIKKATSMMVIPHYKQYEGIKALVNNHILIINPNKSTNNLILSFPTFIPTLCHLHMFYMELHNISIQYIVMSNNGHYWD